MSAQEPHPASTANSAVISWADRLTVIAAEGIEVSLTYSPCESWPHEAEEKPEHRRWQAWATTVPGTDMCQYVYYGSTPDEAMSALYAALYPVEDVVS